MKAMTIIGTGGKFNPHVYSILILEYLLKYRFSSNVKIFLIDETLAL